MPLKSNWVDGNEFAAADANAVADQVNANTTAIAAGVSGLTDIVGDVTPQLGANLDLNGHTVGTATAADLTRLHALGSAAVGAADTQTITNKDLTSGTNTFPTFNQNTTGTAAKVGGIAVTGTPSVGQVPTATSSSAATWQSPTGGGGLTVVDNGNGTITLTGSSVTDNGNGTITLV